MSISEISAASALPVRRRTRMSAIAASAFGRGAEEPTLLVEPVEAPRVHEREGAPLLDADDDPVRELADDVGAPDLGDRRDAAGDRARIETEEAGSRLDGGSGQDPRRRHAGGSAHVHRRDTEARSGEEPVAEDHDREPGGRGEHEEREQAPEARAPARAPAVLAHPLARDERRAL